MFFFPKQFTVGVLNSILKCVRLVSGAVSASGRFVFQFICLPIHLSPRSCVRGCVRLRGICLPVHLSPNSFVSQVLCQGLCPPPGDLSPNSFVRLVSGAVSASGRFVSQFICLPIHLSPRSLSPNSFVSQVLWQGLCPPPGDWFPNSFVSQFICLPGPVSGAVAAFGGFVSQFVCLPSFPKQLTVGVLNSILRCVRLVSGAVSASLGSVSPISPQTVYCWRSQFSFKRCPAMFRWWCLALRMSRTHLSPCGNSFVSQSGWWCPALWLSPIHLFALISTHLFPSLAGGVRLFGCLQFICLPLWQLICLPIWLVVSGSSAVSNSFVSPCGNSFVSQSGWWCPALAVSNSFVLPYGNSFVSQSGWWCPALRLSQSRWWCPALWLSLIHLSPSLAGGVCVFPTIHLFPNLAGGVQLFGWLQFICPPSWHFTCLPVWLVVSGSLAVSNSFVSGLWQFICLPVWLVVSGFLCCLLSPIHLSSLVAIDLSPSLAGGVRLSGCLQVICFPLWQLICFPVWLVVSGLSAVSNSFVSPYTDSFVSQSGWWCPALAVSNSCVSPCGNPFVSQSGWWCSALCASRSPCGWWCPALAMSKLFASRLWQFICLPVWLVASGFLPVSIQLGWWCLALRMSRIHLSPCGNSFVSQSGWWCPALWLSPIHLFALISTHLFPSLAGGVRLFGCLQFICLPLWQLICLPIWLVVSGFGCLQFICLALWQLICLPVWLVVSGSSAVSVTLVMSGSLAVSNSFVSKSGWWRLCLPNDSFVSQSGWWCPAFRLAPIHLSPLVTLHLSPSLAGGVRLSGCLQFICFRLVAIHLSPSLAGGVRLSMLSAVSNSFVFPCGNWFVSQSGWWCPALWLSPSHLFPLVATHLFPSLAGGVRLFGCLQFICLPIYRFVCLPVWLVVSGFGCLQFMCLPLWQSICLPVWLVVFGSLRVSIPVWLVVSGLGYVQVICFPLVAIHLSPSLAGGVRLSACLDPTRLVVSGSSTVSNSFVSPCSNAFVSQSG